MCEFRNSSVLYTIIGQKILFFAVSKFLFRIGSEYRIPETLNAISDRVTKMYEDHFFDRNQSHWSKVLVDTRLTMITKGSGYKKCIELVKMILLNSSEGVRDLIKSTKEDVDNDVNWNESSISHWRKEFHVILPKVQLIDEQLKESSESDEWFSEVRDSFDSSEDDEDEFGEIEDGEYILQDTEDVEA